MSHRPEKLVLALLGEFVLDQRSAPIPATAFLDSLAPFDVPDATTRSTLRRMERRELLRAIRTGRTVAYELTARTLNILREADSRVRSATPFEPSGHGWTLVSFSIPEARREARHQLRSALGWAGFGPIRDGLWIAPGQVDVRAALRAGVQDLTNEALTVFCVDSFDDLGTSDTVHSAWNLDSVRQSHTEFISRWRLPDERTDPVREIIALLADWLDVLRADPRLPARNLPADWPAPLSASTFRAAYERLHATAQEAFTRRVDHLNM